MAHAGFCVQCGKPYETGERFCVGCGQALSEANPVAEASSSPPPYNTQQPGAQFYATQPMMQQNPMHAHNKGRKGLPAWGVALMVLLPVTIALIVFWQPLMAMFQGVVGGEKTEGTMTSAAQPSSSPEMTVESIASSSDKTAPSKDEGSTDGSAANSESEEGQEQDDAAESELSLFSASEMNGFYDFYTVITETTDDGEPFVDADNPVGKIEIMPVYVSMKYRNSAFIHFNQMDTVDGKEQVKAAIITGDELSFYDFDFGEDVVRAYRGFVEKEDGSIVVNGTFEQTLDTETPDERVVRGTWQMISLQPTLFEGVDVSRADKELPWGEPKGTWAGTLTYTGFINLDSTSVFDDTVKAHLKGLHNVPLETSLTFSEGQLKLVIGDNEGGETVLEDFRPVDVRDGWLFTKTMEEVTHPRFLGAVLYRQGNTLRLEGRYSHLIREGDEFVVLKMLIVADKRAP